MRVHWQRLSLVAWREIRERVRTRTFLLSTLAVVVLAVAGIGGGEFLADGFEPSPRELGMTAGTPGELTATLEETAETLDISMELRTLPDEAAGRAALDEGDIDALLVDGERLLFRDEDARESQMQLSVVVNQAVYARELPRRLSDVGLTLEEAQSLLQPEGVPEDLLVPPAGPEAADGEGSEFLGFLTVLVLFMALTFYGTSILMGVVEEKTTRVVEVLLGTLRPIELLSGKVLGILAVGMLQFSLGILAAVIAVLVLGTAELPEMGADTVVWLGVWLLLGLVLYSFVYGTAGSLVSRQEEAGNVTMPMAAVLMASYFLTIFVILDDPDGTAAVVLSMVPVTAPLTMPPRIAAGNPELWQLAVSVVLMLGAVAGIMWLSARLYAGAVLRTGPRVRLLDAWRSSGEAN